MSKWINNILAAASFPGGNSRMVMCTPQLAAEILLLNTHNRKISEAVINKYATEISLGEWYASSAGVGISDKGVLVDGQHRLSAIVKSGQTVPILFVWNLPSASQEKIDRQNKRSLFDVLTLAEIEGIDMPSARLGVQASVLLCRIQNGWGGRSISDAEVKAKFIEYKSEIRFAVKKLSQNPYRGAPFVAAAILMAAGNMEAAEAFCEKLVRPTELSADDPRYRMHRWINEHVGEASGGHIMQEKRLKACFYAMNKFMAGEKCLAIGKANNLIFPSY